MTFERILSHFQVRKRGTGKAQCICPAHADREASLTLTDGNDRALIKCHAGCSTEEVVIAAGLKMSDLFYGDGLAKERWRAYIENREKRKIEAVYNYASINGDYAYTKVRLEGKKMLFGILSNERFAYGLNGKNKKTFNAVYGSISSIKRAIERKEPVFIPEGEKDVNTLVKKGYAAFSCGGANDWNKNVSELCKDADVIVLTDNDDPGKKLASTVVRDLKGTAKSIRIIIPMPEVPKADIMQEAKTEWLYEFFCFSLCTGMRLNEITALKWQDIDYINNVIRVNKTVSWKEGGGIEETLPKSDTSNRDIPMNDTIKKILQMQKTKMSMVYGEIHARKMDSNIFIGSNGAKAIASSTVSSAIDNVLKRLRQQGIEIERFTHHAFRDTFATRYIEEGGNMQTLQKILGHSSLAMTADLYAHVLPNTKQQEMQQIENGFIGVAVL